MWLKHAVALAIVAPFVLATATPAETGFTSISTFEVILDGKAEVNDTDLPALAGDMDGSGSVKLTVDPTQEWICYDFTLDDVGTPLMAHIHRGPASANGPTVVTLFTGPGGDLSDCMPWTDKWLNRIVANPSEFYVNLYTTEFPDGAVRGQLAS